MNDRNLRTQRIYSLEYVSDVYNISYTNLKTRYYRVRQFLNKHPRLRGITDEELKVKQEWEKEKARRLEERIAKKKEETKS